MKNRFVVLAGVALLAAACSSAPPAQQGATTAAAAVPTGPMPKYFPRGESLYPVGAIPSAVLHDAQRNRDITMSIDYPTRGGPYPVIIFSHAFGSSKDAYVGLSEYWAGRGYIVIKPSHADAGAMRTILAERRASQAQESRQQTSQTNDDNRRRGDRRNRPVNLPPEPVAESFWRSQTAADWQNRARDITAIIDGFARLQEQYPELAGKMDSGHIGVAGHSYGAFTAMLVAGAVDFKTSPPLRLGDSRVRAAILMSPQGTSPELGLTPESWRDVKIPVLFLTGSQDRGPSDPAPEPTPVTTTASNRGTATTPVTPPAPTFSAWRHEAFADSPVGNKYFVSFNGGRNSAFTGGTGDLTDQELPTTSTTYPMGQTDQYGRPVMGSPQTQTRRGTNPFESQRRIFASVESASIAFWDAFLRDDSGAKEFLDLHAGMESLNGGQLVVERK